MRIRDAIWSDMEFARKEEAILRTPTFQRLHRIKQLGNTWHVYPSAMHTRFEHSLGVCHVAKILCRQAKVPEEQWEEIALAALLHDITHTPFCHTLADQLGLFPECAAPELHKRRFEDIQNELEQLCVQGLDPGERRELVDLLDNDDFVKLASGKASDLEEPYKAELIGDSFCADLLDYLRRDVYFCGLQRGYDQRILAHAILVDHSDNKLHFGIDITVNSLLDGKERSTSIVSEYVHLLRTRYDLSERVYFYPEKVAADALLCKALRVLLAQGDSIGGRSLNEFLYGSSDETLIENLANRADDQTRYLGRRLKNRDLPFVALQFCRDDLSDTQLGLAAGAFRGRRGLARWLEVEARIAAEAGQNPLDILVFCHEPEMWLKGASVLVRDEHNQVRVLDGHEEVPEARRLVEKHRALWRLYVFSGQGDVESLRKIKTVAEKVLISEWSLS